MLTGLASILICGLTVTTLSACSSDDDKNDKADATVEKEIMYAVQISDDVLKVANVEVNYVDQTGAKKKEALSSAQWTKSQKLNNTSPLAQGIWVKITPKTNVASGTYQLKVTTGVACKATRIFRATTLKKHLSRRRLQKKSPTGVPRALLAVCL